MCLFVLACLCDATVMVVCICLCDATVMVVCICFFVFFVLRSLSLRFM